LKIAIVDMDNTLVLPTFLTRICWKLSQFFRQLGIKLENYNVALVNELRDYDKVYILTGRSNSDVKLTLEQVRRVIPNFSVEPKPSNLILGWKKQTVNAIEKLYPEAEVTWYDDEFS